MIGLLAASGRAACSMRYQALRVPRDAVGSQRRGRCRELGSAGTGDGEDARGSLWGMPRDKAGTRTARPATQRSGSPDGWTTRLDIDIPARSRCDSRRFSAPRGRRRCPER